VILEQKLLRGSLGAQWSRKPFVDCVHDYSPPQPALGDEFLGCRFSAGLYGDWFHEIIPSLFHVHHNGGAFCPARNKQVHSTRQPAWFDESLLSAASSRFQGM
jgi:hypothetical protein